MEPLELLYVVFYLIFGAGVGLYLRYDPLVESLKLRKRRDFSACCAWIVFATILWVPCTVGLIGLVVLVEYLGVFTRKAEGACLEVEYE